MLVLHEWLDRHALALDGDYESAAVRKAGNGQSVWECYVAGLDPTSATNRFLAEIVFDGNDLPAVSWTPDLNEDGTKHERDYVVEGKTNLVDAAWIPTNAATRFFRVRVRMP